MDEGPLIPGAGSAKPSKASAAPLNPMCIASAQGGGGQCGWTGPPGRPGGDPCPISDIQEP